MKHVSAKKMSFITWLLSISHSSVITARGKSFGEGSERMSIKKRRILLVDDSEDDRAMFKDWLSQGRSAKYDFDEADSIDEGVRKYWENQFDCVVLDHSFPMGSAVDFLSRVRNPKSNLISAPVVVITGQGSESVAVSAMKAGAYDYINKDRLKESPKTNHIVEDAIVEFDRLKRFRAVEVERDQALEDLRVRKNKLADLVLQLKRAKSDAEAANLAKSAFLANMSHEIRSPLTAIIGFTELLLNGDIPPAEQDYLHRTIHRNGKHLLGVINDILDFSKVEAGKIVLRSENFDLESLITEVTDAFRAMIEKKNVRLRLFIHPDIPKTITSDPLRVRQILTNLISNAMKFTAHGEITVIVQPQYQDDVCTHIAVSVSDSGVGISRVDAANLFRRFGQANDEISGNFGGTGLGLVLSRKLARLLGGDLQLISSEPGVGSLFKVLIPTSGMLEDVEAHHPLKIADETISLDGLSILVVDDSEDNQFLIRHLLERVGAEVECVSGGAEALNVVKRRSFDTILMDIQMPLIDGHETSRLLKKHGYQTPVIGLTAHALPEDRSKSASAGFVDQLTKPIDSQELIKTIFTICESNASMNNID